MKTLVMVLACALPLAAQEGSTADSAKARAIVARHVAASGGRSAFAAMTHLHSVTVTSMPSPMGSGEVRTEMWVRVPNMVYMKMDMPGVGPMEMGYDGRTAWTLSQSTGPVILDDVPQSLLNSASFAGPPLDKMPVWYIGRRQIGSRSFDALRVTLPDSQRATFYYDVATGLLAGMDPDGAPPPPEGRMTLSFDEYKRFGGILQATKLTTIAQGREMVARVESVSHEPFDEKIFAPPPAVQQLLTKKP